ncbi:MAG TPA: delta-60 repeat domain-containing protein [Candidatus Saccharimonadales bacterium]|nr:delta-60 repeat domain-containing protein [Candidatus Saccharimonadales bacterium]
MDQRDSKTFLAAWRSTALCRISAVLLTVFLCLSGCSNGGDTQSPASTTTSNDPSAPGTPNTGPGTGGSDSTGSNGSIPVRQLADLNGDVTDLALHPDGDIVVAGTFSTYGGQPVPHVIKLRPDGSLAPWTLGVSLINSLPVETAISPDGKVWIAQRQGDVARLWRVSNDGTLDSGFVPVDFLFDESSGGVIPSQIFQVEPIGNGVYVVGTFTRVNGQPRRGLVRILGTGQLDGGFNADIPASAYRVAPNPDGTLYVTNFERLDVSVVGSQILYRLNADGSRVSGFSPVNVYTVGFNARIYALARVADDTNDVLVGGGFVLDASGTVNPLFDPTAIHNLARVNPDGSRDRVQPRPQLGTDSTNTPIVRAIAKTIDGSSDFILTADEVRRFRADGTPVPGFQVGQTNSVDDTDKLLCMPDGDTVVGGTFTTYNGTSRGHIVRINRDGSQR